jgi:hypothetical protein
MNHDLAQTAKSKRTAQPIWPERNIRALSLALAAATIFGFAGWIYYIRTVAVAPPAEGTINVVSATFGGNCGADKDNAQQIVQSACSGKALCNFAFDWRLLGNPAPTCSKEFRVEWRCSPEGPILAKLIPAEPKQGLLIPLSCR